MVQYRDLNAPPSRMLADVVADMKASERQSKTGDAGVKDLGESGDVVWPRTDGEVASIRDVDLELADARQRIEDAEGDLAGAQARIDTALDAEGHVREDEILRNATLLGDTVVEQINVTDKLVGTDGVFTGTVDFANVNVTGELLANEISGEHIYGTVIEGGEIRTGTDESRGSFLLGDRAYVHPVDGYETPGIRLDPPNSTLLRPPGVGVIGGSVEVSGGRAADDRYSRLRASVSGVTAESSPAADDPVGWRSVLDIAHGSLRLSAGPQASTNGAEVSVKAPVFLNGEEVGRPHVRLQIARNGRSAKIEASNGTATIESSDGATTRSLKVDSTGVWVTTNRDGTQKHYNLEETAQDSGWHPIEVLPGYTAQPNYEPKARKVGNLIYLSGGIDGSGIPANARRDVMRLPVGFRPVGQSIYVVGGSSTARACPLLVMKPDGVIDVRTAPDTGSYYLMDGLSFIPE